MIYKPYKFLIEQRRASGPILGSDQLETYAAKPTFLPDDLYLVQPIVHRIENGKPVEEVTLTTVSCRGIDELRDFADTFDTRIAAFSAEQTRATRKPRARRKKTK